jgi:glycosyltransferase involved in cell wall biosynthesis
MIQPLVSICCLAYNQESFISQAIEGFLMQKTDFPIEIIIHDDASTDNTSIIIRSYEEKYPELIKTIFQEENQYSKSGGNVLTHFILPFARGKYVALCEGDDYWVDPFKLQKQVKFLEANPDYTFSVGRVDELIQKTGEIKRMKERVNPLKNETYTLKDYLKFKFSQTSSFVFRNSEEPFPEWFFRAHALDQSIVIIMTVRGKIKYHKDLFSIYRINESSISFTATYNVYERFLETLINWKDYLGEDYSQLIKFIQLRTLQHVRLSKSNNLLSKIIYHIILGIVNFKIKFL